MHAEPSPAPRRRGRPRSEELTTRRRHELIEAAYAVFAKKGYAAAGVPDIAAHLDIGHGTFYRYFDSKRDVLDHVVDYGVDLFMRATFADVPPGSAQSLDEFLGQLRAISGRVFTLAETEPGLVQVMLLEATSIDEELTERLMGLMDTFAAMTATYLEHGVRAGFLREDLDTEVAAKALGALLGPGLLRTLRGEFPPATRKRYEDSLVALVSDGVRAR
jgi:AcrR family transcriptional regulator